MAPKYILGGTAAIRFLRSNRAELFCPEFIKKFTHWYACRPQFVDLRSTRGHSHASSAGNASRKGGTMRISRPAPAAGSAGSVVQDTQAPSAPARVANTEWPNRPRGIRRVPTHSVGRARERRAYARARLSLPLRLERVAGQRHTQPHSLRTANISSSGLFFLAPLRMDAGTPIELEVQLIHPPLARATVRMSAAAHVVRSEPAEQAGWYGVAAAFDDISYRRDENLLERSSP